ncbi:hypothetical protein GJ744_006931 [Endocarpon pusillum]|uniref:Uncharacterized protein n=1 Tax=Endocarpon pusillum TaxID=364733 RepID=A0A8H7E6H4_9EURO|nr:hypothetical protein GJ744_006931 [Endocarpon pusillum]
MFLEPLVEPWFWVVGVLVGWWYWWSWFGKRRRSEECLALEWRRGSEGDDYVDVGTDEEEEGLGTITSGKNKSSSITSVSIWELIRGWTATQNQEVSRAGYMRGWKLIA